MVKILDQQVLDAFFFCSASQLRAEPLISSLFEAETNISCDTRVVSATCNSPRTQTPPSQRRKKKQFEHLWQLQFVIADDNKELLQIKQVEMFGCCCKCLTLTFLCKLPSSH